MRRNMVTLLCGMIGLAAWTAVVSADSLIFEYQSSLGTMPTDQGWGLDDENEVIDETPGPGVDDCPRRPVRDENGDGDLDPICALLGGEDGDQNRLHDNDGTRLGNPSPVGNSGGGYLDGTNSPDVVDPDDNGVDFPRLNYGANPNDLFEGYLANYVWVSATPWDGYETYSEWIEFDDGEDNLEHVATVSGPPTPKGAQDFPGAPPHPPLRLVGGDGNGVLYSLPFVSSFNNQHGSALISKTYAPLGLTGTITAVFRGALSVTQEGDAPDTFLLVRAYDPAAGKRVYFAFAWFMPRTYSGGVPICDANPPSGDCGKFALVNLQNGTSAQACAGADGRDFDTPLLDGSGGGPNLGRVMPNEFFTFRVICDPSNGGTATIWVNEDTANPTTGVVTNTTYSDFRWGCKNTDVGGNRERAVMFGLRNKTDSTAWVDYMKVYEGAVEPPEVGPCTFASDPVFDVSGPTADVADSKVDELDLDVFGTECYTGPAPAVGAFDALSQRCKCMDLNGDFAIDHEDFGRFQACYTGADGTLDTSCDD